MMENNSLLFNNHLSYPTSNFRRIKIFKKDLKKTINFVEILGMMHIAGRGVVHHVTRS